MLEPRNMHTHNANGRQDPLRGRLGGGAGSGDGAGVLMSVMWRGVQARWGKCSTRTRTASSVCGSVPVPRYPAQPTRPPRGVCACEGPRAGAMLNRFTGYASARQ